MNFTPTMAANAELDIAKRMSRKASQGFDRTRDIFRKIYRYSEDEYYVMGDDNKISGPFTYEGLEMSLESWYQTIDEYISDYEYLFCVDTDLDYLKEHLLSAGYEEHEVDQWIDLNGELFMSYFKEEE